MPWCHQCGRLVEEDDEAAGEPPDPAVGVPEVLPPGADAPDADAPDTAARDRCPACGTVLEVDDDAGGEEAHVKAPWHFKVLVVGTVVYLGYRLYQGIGWLIHHA
ncbi:MAG: hypothetical protein ACLP1E_01215 [Acidimicrobiales bacterium]